jgi:UDP-glucose 6-dehydrogenase
MESKCIPKDVYAFAAWAESLGYIPQVTQAILDKNKEWISENP